MRKQWIEHENKIPIVRQCKLLGVNRSSLYYEPKIIDNNEDIKIMNEIRDIYGKNPFYGYRKIHIELLMIYPKINIKKTRRLKTLTGLMAIGPYKKTSVSNSAHKKYPYRLKELVIYYPNKVWKTDITYIKIKGDFLYLVCIIDVFSRKIVGWAVSNSLGTDVCLEAYFMARAHGKPDIFNTDQGCQFTSSMWIEQIEADGIQISMDGVGRWADNIIIERFWRSLKYEAIFLNCPDTVADVITIIKVYIMFYNRRFNIEVHNFSR